MRRKKFINDDEQQIFLWTYSHSASCFTYCAQYLRRRYLNFFSFVSFLSIWEKHCENKIWRKIITDKKL